MRQDDGEEAVPHLQGIVHQQVRGNHAAGYKHGHQDDGGKQPAQGQVPLGEWIGGQHNARNGARPSQETYDQGVFVSAPQEVRAEHVPVGIGGKLLGPQPESRRGCEIRRGEGIHQHMPVGIKEGNAEQGEKDHQERLEIRLTLAFIYPVLLPLRSRRGNSAHSASLLTTGRIR